MKRFNKINNITGWGIFVIATIVYWLTVEPTASYWDCGEFIAVSYKLEVPHPPGAPFFLLIGRLFSFLARGNVEKMKDQQGITQLHGKIQEIEIESLKIKLIPLFHPAAIIYNRTKLTPLWEQDMEIVKKEIKELE